MKFLFDTSKVIKKVKDMNETLERMREKYQNEAQGLFNELTTGFFKAYPEVKNIYWTQYTPHFNDGDECEFSLNEIYYTIDRDYSASKFKTDEESTSEWDVIEDDEDEDYGDDEFDDEGDQFSSKKVTVIEAEISRYENLLVPGFTPQHTSHTSYAFDFSYGPSYTTHIYTFNPTKCRQRIEQLKQELEDNKKELEQFPNRDEIITAIEQVKTFIKSVDDALMKSIFGDHVRVVLTKDGSQTFEFEHE